MREISQSLILIFSLILFSGYSKTLNSEIASIYWGIDQNFNIIKNQSASIQKQIESQNVTDQNLVAICQYQNALNQTGWYLFHVITNKNYSDREQAYAGGKCEGAQSHQQIYDAYINFYLVIFHGKPLSASAQKFVDNQNAWMKQMVETNPTSDYWQMVGLFLQQLQGTYDGYKSEHAPGQELTFNEFYYLTNMGDLEDIMLAFDTELFERREHRGECNAFVKITDTDLLSAHSTFNNYALMLRIYKIYDLYFQNPLSKHNRVQFSSRPGDLESKDDWYIFGNMVSMETSFLNYNKSNFGYLHSDSVPCWLRAQLSNKISVTAPEWVNNFQLFRSGTHNSQWFAVDYNQYRRLKSNPSLFKKDIIWVAEEFFYLYSKQDLTGMLVQQGYVAGYNMPINQEIYEAGNLDPKYDYSDTYRANLFREYQRYGGQPVGMKALLYLNMNLTGYPCGVPPTYIEASSIAVRCDYLVPTIGDSQYFGLIDGKFTTNSLISSGSSYIKCGPTTSGFPNYFSWDLYPDKTISHLGQPTNFNFSWNFLNLSSVEKISFDNEQNNINWEQY